MQQILISKMVKEDIPGICIVEETAFPIPWPASSFEEELKNILATYFIAKIDSKVVGYIGMWFIMDECHITNIAVHKDYRKQGIGAKLVNEMFKECKKHGTTYIELEVRISNKAAQSLYKKFGFTEEVVRKDYYKNPDSTHEDAIVMIKDI